MFIATIRKCGQSLVMTIPQAAVRSLALHDRDRVGVIVTEGGTMEVCRIEDMLRTIKFARTAKCA